MRCPACGGENVDGAKFCGVCGKPMPRVTAETREIPEPRHASQAPAPGMSLGESIDAPRGGGGRGAKIAIILALDAALAIGGVVLMTRGGGGGEAVAEGAKPGNGAATGTGAGEGTASGGDTVPGGGGAGGGGGVGTGAGGGGGGVTGSGGGGAMGGGSGGHHAGSGTGTGTSIGTGAGTGSDDNDPISAAAAAAAAAAAGKIDAGAGTPPAIDAGVAAPPPVDAAPAVETPVDAAEAPGPGIDAPEAAASAAELAGHLARLVVQSSSKMDRCYQNATKALPEDQPLSGEVEIGLAVMPTGQIQNVRVTRNTTGSTDLGNCVQATASQWTFPAHAESEPVEFVHVFRFGPRPN